MIYIIIYSNIENILTYISDNVANDISLETLAQQANLSVYYFIRVFKRETHTVRHMVRRFVLGSHVGLFLTLCFYSCVKWFHITGVALPIICCVILVIGLITIYLVYKVVVRAYQHALLAKSNQ